MNAHTYIGVGFPCLRGYRCLAIPSDKQSRLGSHLLFCSMATKSNNYGNINLFRKRIKDPELCRLRDLLAIVYASGEMTTKERTTILEIAAKHNISSSKFHQMLEIDPDSVQDIYPTSEEDRYQYLYELIYLMTVNRKHSTRAIDYIRFIAARWDTALKMYMK